MKGFKIGTFAAWALLAGAGVALAGDRHPDPASIIPMDQVAPERRDEVAEVIRENTFTKRGETDTFPCNPKVYLALLNEPAITLALWQDLSSTPAKLQQIGPNLYQGSDGNGTTATWEYVLRSPRLHVMYCDLDYTGPRGNAKLKGRIVMVVRTGYFKEVNGEPWVQHDVEAFVKIDSKGWRAAAATVRPILERVLAEQVEEAGWFVSLMGRLVDTYPDWAAQTTLKQGQIPLSSRMQFRDLVVQVRKPNASRGRPTVADAVSTTAVAAGADPVRR
ncbi:MAG: hypothetical protein U0800_12130 [Isosphaeraceae bacterium]